MEPLRRLCDLPIHSVLVRFRSFRQNHGTAGRYPCSSHLTPEVPRKISLRCRNRGLAQPGSLVGRPRLQPWTLSMLCLHDNTLNGLSDI